MPWIQTYTGKRIDPWNYSEDDFCIEDVARSLAFTNRFSGHSSRPYSVAQHSLMVSELCDEDHALWGLLHDAAEAYIGDFAAPLKGKFSYCGMPISELENRILSVIMELHCLPATMPASVKHADTIACAAERTVLMESDHDWGEIDEFARRFDLPRLQRMTHWTAEYEFTKRYEELI